MKVVFEYSYLEKSFDIYYNKYLRLIKEIYQDGIDKYTVYAMNTDNNCISDKISKEFELAFKFIEKNKALFNQYCDFMFKEQDEYIKKFGLLDEPVAGKVFNQYVYRQTNWIILNLLKKVFDYTFNKLANDNEFITLDAYTNKDSFKFYLKQDKLDEQFLQKLEAKLLGVIDLPIDVIFEIVLPAFCERFSDYDEIEENQFNIASYEIGLA